MLPLKYFDRYLVNEPIQSLSVGKIFFQVVNFSQIILKLFGKGYHQGKSK